MKKSKLYTLISILVAVLIIIVVIALLLFTSVFTTRCEKETTEEGKISVAEETRDGKEVVEEIRETSEDETEAEGKEEAEEGKEEETTEEAAVEEVEEETAEEETAEETEEAIAPTISLEIYSGPTFSPADSVCYYRVKAKVTGTPAPAINFSRDDSGGAWGSNICQVNLHDSAETYILTATATNSEGVAEDSITLSWGCEEENSPPQVTDIILSEEDIYIRTEYEVTAVAADPDGDSLTYQWSAEDGTLSNSGTNPTKWKTPSSEGYYDLTVIVNDGRGGIDNFTKDIHVEMRVLHMPISKEIHPSDIGYIVYPSGVNTTELIIGDSISNTNVQGFFSFDVSPFRGKTILDAKLRSNTYIFYPDPSFKGNIIIIYKDYLPLGADDYVDYSLLSPYVFNNTKNPLEISDSRLVERLQQKVDTGGKLQFAIFYAKNASDGDHTIDGRQYSKESITLTVLCD